MELVSISQVMYPSSGQKRQLKGSKVYYMSVRIFRKLLFTLEHFQCSWASLKFKVIKIVSDVYQFSFFLLIEDTVYSNR